MHNNKPRIMVCGESLAIISGFCYVAASIAEYFLRNNYTTAYFIITGRLLPQDFKYENILGIENPETRLKGLTVYQYGEEAKRMESFAQAVLDFRPDIVISYHDTWSLEFINFNSVVESFLWTAYVPVEVPELEDRILVPSKIFPNQHSSTTQALQSCDLVIPMSNMAKTALEKMQGPGGLKIPNIGDAIPNGLEIKKIKPIKQLHKDFQHLKDKFIFFFMGANSDRKRIDRVLMSYQILCNNPNIDRNSHVLFIHTTNRSFNGVDVEAAAYQMGIRDNIIIDHFNSNSPTSVLYEKYYRSVDCVVNTPGGEGFGYATAEAAAHGIPVIYANWSASKEYLQHCENTFPVECEGYFYYYNSSMKMCLADIKQTAEYMEICYNKKFERSEKNFKFMADNYNWTSIGQRFESQILEAYEKSDKLKGIIVERII